MDDSRLTKKILKYDLVFGEMGTKDCWSTDVNKENNVFKDALGVKGLGFKHHGIKSSL